MDQYLCSDGGIFLDTQKCLSIYSEKTDPTPELANHRTPIKNLYCTGGFWHVGGEASCFQSYNCYKIIASDMNIAKPWEEPGKKEPYSLVAELRGTVDRMRKMFPRGKET